MTIAIGGTSGAPSTSHGQFWVNVQDYGAKANGTTDCTSAFQAAIDDLAARLDANGGESGVVFVPSGKQPYLIGSPIWVDHDGIEIRGEGWGSVLSTQGGTPGSVLIYGLRRIESHSVNGQSYPLSIDSTYRPDLYGKLDSSVITNSNVKWGFRTNQDSYAVFQASALNAGVPLPSDSTVADGWSTVTQLTLEFCIEPPDGQSFPTTAPILGMGLKPFYPSPFLVSTWDDPKKLCVLFRTSDCDPDNIAHVRSFQFRLGTNSPPYRIAIQVDLAAATCSAFVNGTQVTIESPINLDSSGASAIPFIAGTGLTFLTNEYYPFLIGAEGFTSIGNGTSPIDLRLYGLRVSNCLRYRNDGAGQPQRRVDSPSTTIVDAYAYFANDSNTIAFLPFTDSPSNAGRKLSVQHGTSLAGGTTTSGLILHAYPCSRTAGSGLCDLSLELGSTYGQGISVGNTTGFHASNILCRGGYHAVGSIPTQAQSDMTIRACTMQASDASIYAFQQTLSTSDLTVESAGKTVLRAVGSDSIANCTNVLNLGRTSDCIFKYHGPSSGGKHRVTDLSISNNSGRLQTAVIYCDTHLGSQLTFLSANGLRMNGIGATPAVVMVKDRIPDSKTKTSTIDLSNIVCATTDARCIVDMDGPLWSGLVEAQGYQCDPIVHRQKWGSLSRITITDRQLVAPPRTGSIYANSYRIQVPTTVDSQFSQWICIQTGAYGTSNPPHWIGLSMIKMSPSSLSSYILNHAFVQATLS